MSDTVVLAIIAGLPVTLTALGGLIVIIRQNMTSSKKLDHITVLTNSTLSTTVKELKIATDRIEALEKIIADMQTNARRFGGT